MSKFICAFVMSDLNNLRRKYFNVILLVLILSYLNDMFEIIVSLFLLYFTGVACIGV